MRGWDVREFETRGSEENRWEMREPVRCGVERCDVVHASAVREGELRSQKKEARKRGYSKRREQEARGGGERKRREKEARERG